MSTMRVLVTGATGFIGLHLVAELAAAGHQVVGVDLNPPGPPGLQYLGPLAERVRFVQADITRPGALADAVPSADAIVHAAVITSTAEVEATHPERVVDVNLLGTLEVLWYGEQARVRRFVYVSSSGVYGESDPEMPIPESQRLQLTTLYTMTKFASERLVASARARGRIEAASARIAAPYGPMEHPTGVRTVMSPLYHLVQAAAKGRSVGISRPETRRDWTHASDIALGLRLLVDAHVLPHDCYNLSSGQPASLAEAADLLAELAPGFSWHTAAEDRADIEGARAQRRGPLDTRRIRDHGFAPRYSLREGLSDTLRWFRRLGPTDQAR